MNCVTLLLWTVELLALWSQRWSDHHCRPVWILLRRVVVATVVLVQILSRHRGLARWRSRRLDLLTLLLDLGKGLVAVLLARHFFPGVPGDPSDVAVGAAVAAVVGHVFPVWLGFKGGKGVATALGVFLALAPKVALGGVVVFLLIVGMSRIVSLASIIAAAVLPIFAMLLSQDRSPAYLGGVLFIALLVIVKHQANIQRLMAGTENRFGSKGKKASA